MRESAIEAALVAEVKARGGEVRKVKWIGRRGAPDRFVMVPSPPGFPRSAWVELKATGKEPEPHQVREHERMRRMGQHVVVVNSLEGIQELLQCLCSST